ncbi:nucleoside hydrolase [Granulicoccus sp. GXG6511]|uniref:nucleoside hydrolase n=1 Tax=Granulicoccus sp. GXG6511 TaxID=3381351 RepID=UPI003D7C8322
MRTIVLDCDPGLDDAVALMLAAADPHIELAAVTTVAGNQTLRKVTDNARRLAGLLGVTAPVAAGCGRPLVRTPAWSTVHGDSGLGGVTLTNDPVGLDPRHGVDLIIETVLAREAGVVTLVPVGPLTNIAMAVRKEPRIVEHVREVVLMGGGYHAGNRTAVAEFNILTDPEAAAIVFGEPWPVTMVGLDLTWQALATPAVLARIAAVGTAAAELVVAMLGSYGEAYRAHRFTEGPPVHDPCAVAYVIDPTLITTRRAPITVELTGTATLGMTVADFRDPEPDCSTQVAVDLDVPRFWDLVIEALRRLP